MNLQRLLVHASRYSIGSLLITLSSFISFPILTRMLSVEDYGLMSLVSLLLGLIVGVGKLGMQHSIVRFYAESDVGHGSDGKRREFFSTVIIGLLVSSSIVMTLWLLGVWLAPRKWWADPAVVPLLFLTAVLVVTRVMDSSFLNILRAQQRSGSFSLYSVLRKYLGLGLIMLILFFVVPGVTGFYVGTVVSEVVALLVLGFLLLRKEPVSLGSFSPTLFKAMAAFGLPMIGYEVSGIVLNIGDRFVLEHLIGAQALGLYSVAYNMCEYINGIIIASIAQALIPMYTRLWTEKGPRETKAFIEQALHFYVLVGVLLVAGCAAAGPSFLTALASDKYHAGGVTIPWIIAGLVLDSGLPLVAAGIFIQKRTRILMLLVAICAVFNIALNFVLIPRFGITGSAMATVASYAMLSGTAMVVGARLLPIRFPVLAALKFAVLGVITYFVLVEIHLDNRWALLAVQAVVGCTVYGAMVLAIDRTSRNALAAGLRRLRGTGGEAVA